MFSTTPLLPAGRALNGGGRHGALLGQQSITIQVPVVRRACSHNTGHLPTAFRMSLGMLFPASSSLRKVLLLCRQLNKARPPRSPMLFQRKSRWGTNHHSNNCTIIIKSYLTHSLHIPPLHIRSALPRNLSTSHQWVLFNHPRVVE